MVPPDQHEQPMERRILDLHAVHRWRENAWEIEITAQRDLQRSESRWGNVRDGKEEPIAEGGLETAECRPQMIESLGAGTRRVSGPIGGVRDDGEHRQPVRSGEIGRRQGGELGERGEGGPALTCEREEEEIEPRDVRHGLPESDPDLQSDLRSSRDQRRSRGQSPPISHRDPVEPKLVSPPDQGFDAGPPARET